MADFEWYRSFVAIYRMGTVSAAAESRHMTQPALSQHLASLEAQVGEPLFVRQPCKMVPTQRGSSCTIRLRRRSTGWKGPRPRCVKALGERSCASAPL